MDKYVFITGATSGIGKACAQEFAKNGFQLIITGRRKERLVELQQELTQFGVDVQCLHFDVRDLDAVKTAILSLSE
ncbi:MAG: SDR family NAD(P)-dependent oxidoreductase, partial [Bacteroidia bacterium]